MPRTKPQTSTGSAVGYGAVLGKWCGLDVRFLCKTNNTAIFHRTHKRCMCKRYWKTHIKECGLVDPKFHLVSNKIFGAFPFRLRIYSYLLLLIRKHTSYYGFFSIRSDICLNITLFLRIVPFTSYRFLYGIVQSTIQILCNA